MRRVILAILLLVALAVPQAQATNYYVATTGDDANDGSLANPWRHVCYAIGGGGSIVLNTPVLVEGDRAACATTNPTELAAGDIVYLRGGTYQEHFISISTLASSGTAGNPITVKNYPGETPIVDGGFTSNPGMTNSKAVFWVNNGASYWTFDGLEVKRGVGSGFTIGDDVGGGGGCPGATGYACNVIIQNSDIHSIIVADNTAPVYVGVAAYALTVQQNKLRDITGDNGTPPNRGAGVELFLSGNNHVIRNNEIYHTMLGVWHKHGALLAGPYVNNSTVVRNNYIHDLCAGTHTCTSPSTIGVATKTTNMLVENNLIVDVLGNGIGIRVDGTCDRTRSSNTRITHNTIIRAGASAIGTKQDNTRCLDQGMNTVVEDNLIYTTVTGSGSDLALWPTLFTTWRTPWTVSTQGTPTGQLQWTYPTAGMFSHALDFYTYSQGSVGATEPDWASCTVAGCELVDGGVTWIAVAKQLHNTTSNYNLVWSTDSSTVWRLYATSYSSLSAWNTATAADPGSPGYPTTGQDLNSVQAAPIFADYAGGDYTLTPTSPGYRAASDGTDMGAKICEVGITPNCRLARLPNRAGGFRQ